MTAEVGILTKIGVALAADSAVTIRNSNSEKVYNTVNKLFSLSKEHPVGIMIYGASSFMGTPWEVIIKEYRVRLGSKSFADLEMYVEDFLTFLISDKRFYNSDYEQILIMKMLQQLLPQLKGKVDSFKSSFEEKYHRDPNSSEIESHIIQLLNNHIGKLKTKAIFFNPNKSLLENHIHQHLNGEYYSVILDRFEKGLERKINSADLINKIFEYMAILNIYKSELYSSGIVITGYGDNDIFPKLIELKIEGIIFGFLKYTEKNKTKIDAFNCTSSINAFAQQEMIWSFVRGIEPTLNDAYLKIFQDSLTTYLDEKGFSAFKSDIPQVMDSIKDHLYKYQRQKYINPLLNVVRSLPKEDLAMMAETLVHLTSFKRKVSMDVETVGGPIDVAFISKGDGFIWINRKHYFKPELNYAYFQNYLRGD